MLRIGLTGGIASGKSRVSELFSSRGVPVVDTDIISRQLLDIDQPGYHQVLDHFDRGILLENRQIDRVQLRRLVFNNKVEKEWLEAMLHPVIYQKSQQLIETNNSAAYVLVVIPLLFESDFGGLVDRVLVIDCSAETQIRRLLARDNIDRTLANQMLAQQWNNKDRLDQADDIIDNDSDLELDRQVTELHTQYLALANSLSTETR
jgi:dephospho-CoA kinase